MQAIELSMSLWRAGRRYEWALQWQNVGEGAPQWRLWDARRSWVALQLPGSLRGEEWHVLRLAGRLDDDRVRYEDFTVDGRVEGLHGLVERVPAPAEPYTVLVGGVCLERRP